ncbi:MULTISPECIES: caspase family protein [Haloarcula]|uniref:caspase family protein n=1 Tax=Haloarcula TaxID=2237 RepID=UPI000F8CBD09|nr:MULTISPECIES: caspase family protein [Haloarcula]NHX38501.1 caspase family protein [Haloarcula sp. R1-2]
MTLTFEPLDDRPGLAVIDQIERQRYRVHTPTPIALREAAADVFQYPVGDAVRIRTRAIELPTVVMVYVRDDDGAIAAEVAQFESETLPADDYVLDPLTQIKTYMRVEDAEVEVTVDSDRTRIEFDAPTDLLIGARSQHDRPAATVTTTEQPADVMAAVETFGSALKAHDPERSYPTLRGHPPALEIGDTLDIPADIDSPDTGVTLELPPDLASIFVAAPLSYYLGASLVPASEPRLTTDTGFTYSLDTARGFESEVGRTLKRLFFLDCVTRTEGFHQIDLHERAAIEPYVDLDFQSLYQQQLAEQVATYLQVPYDVIEDHIPKWRLTTHIDPVPANAEQLPYVVDDLAIVRTHQQQRLNQASVPAEAEAEFTRDDVITRAASSDAATGPTETDYVEPQAEDSLEQAWIGDSIPIGASKLTKAAFEHRLDRDTNAEDITIRVVQNDARMDEERQLVDEVYGTRDDLPFDVTVHDDLTTAELRTVLTTDAEFFHYIGHTEHDGFVCRDGKLDVTTLDSVGVDTFLLNACNSYNQGLSLVEKGAIGGIVTLNEVLNDGAVRIGESVARLLNCGFPLRAALTIARGESILGGQYIVVGDGGVTVTQTNGGMPNLLEIQPTETGYTVEMNVYSTDDKALGAIMFPHITRSENHYLVPGEIDTFNVSKEELTEFLQMQQIPVRNDGDLYWSNSIDLDSIH